MGEDGEEIKTEFENLIQQMNENNTPDDEQLGVWQGQLRGLGRRMHKMDQESKDTNQPAACREQKVAEYYEMLEVCSPLQGQAELLYKDKENQHVQSRMAGESTAKPAARTSDAVLDAELKQTEAHKREAMPPPLPPPPVVRRPAKKSRRANR